MSIFHPFVYPAYRSPWVEEEEPDAVELSKRESEIGAFYVGANEPSR